MEKIPQILENFPIFRKILFESTLFDPFDHVKKINHTLRNSKFMCGKARSTMQSVARIASVNLSVSECHVF